MAEAQTSPQPPPADPVAGLIGIPLPDAVSLWPQTWTARITIAVVLAVAVVAAWKVIRQWHANRYRREALAELARIEANETPNMSTELALLVRRTALAAFPREQIVALTGPAWLSFLDRSYGGQEFSHGAGSLLEAAAYRPAPPDRSQLQTLIDLTRRWIKVHHA